jgi:tRNA pseudouridine55 synthase
MSKDVVRAHLCGILNVDKPPGVTSHDVVVAVRRMVRQRKVGHAGTLDPMATGVLLVCLGQATRVSEYLMRSSKTYRAVVRLGISTTTDDADGEITGQSQVSVTREQVEDALQHFVGRICQVPPVYSAIKRDGKRLYELARRGIDVDVPAREVDIHWVRILEWAPSMVQFEVHCGPGTYVRALARDLGVALGCGAHLWALRRIASGSFAVADALTLDQLGQALAEGRLSRALHPLDTAFLHLPALPLDLDASHRLSMGQQVEGAVADGEGSLARAYAPDGRLVALVAQDEHTLAWRPHKVFLQPSEIVST